MAGRRRAAAWSALTAVACTLVSCTASPHPDEPTPTATANPAIEARASQPGALSPAQPVWTELEDSPPVQGLRHDFIVTQWSYLNDLCTTDEYQALVDESFWQCKVFGKLTDSFGRPTDSEANIGPGAFTPLDVVQRDDGQVDVVVCQMNSPAQAADRTTHEIPNKSAGWKSVAVYTVSQLAPAEVTALQELDLSSPEYRVRAHRTIPEFCTDTEVVGQRFVDWASTAAFSGEPE